ncbi:uncharacterized protein VICG_01239 [Vittaforma corneae ATCC 50505]|uniref:Uncharacterized protein n=1 Tax=Vittaforma corneae (strain ATCC 50505) TaxID=993615 RepID=L2GML5_VITCO|nr:uncharacterized protein VICG_01239 [Vittaforma corneae ATCC 50505]ELA41735.1 hypothetical protein VICG_01239 [Vittaforma corneae ATCC 50505]
MNTWGEYFTEKLDDLYNMATDSSGAVIPENVLTELQDEPFGPLMVKMYKFFNCSAGLNLYLGVLCIVVLLAYLLINHENYYKYNPLLTIGYCLLFFKIVFYAYTCGVMSSLIGDVSPAGSLPIYYNILYLYGAGVLFVEFLMLGLLQDLLLLDRKTRFTFLFKDPFVILRTLIIVGLYYTFLSIPAKIDLKGMIIVVISLAMQLFLLYILPIILHFSVSIVVKFIKKVT